MNRTTLLPALAAAALVGACSTEPEDKATSADPAEAIKLETPESIASEHRELHETLAEATQEQGLLGEAARNLEAALAPHFRREEEIATPPLSLVPDLAQGPATRDMRKVLPMTDALERELPQMLREHDAIRSAAVEFGSAAKEAGRADYVAFAENLAAHARQEEEILYPAAIMVGKYVRLAAPEEE